MQERPLEKVKSLTLIERLDDPGAVGSYSSDGAAGRSASASEGGKMDSLKRILLLLGGIVVMPGLGILLTHVALGVNPSCHGNGGWSKDFGSSYDDLRKCVEVEDFRTAILQSASK